MINGNVQTSSNEESSSSTPSNNNGAKKTLFVLKKRMFSSPIQRASDIIISRNISDSKEPVENTEIIRLRPVANTNIVDSTIQQDPETNCSSANDEILSSFNHFSAEISRISEHRVIKEDVDVSQLSNNEIDECGTMYSDLLETISDVFLNLPKHLIKTQPGFNDSIYTKSKAVVEKLKKITKYRTIKLNAQHNGPRTIYSEPSVERSVLLENSLPSSSGSVINICSSIESISENQNESSIKKKNKSSFVPKTRKSTSLDNSKDEQSTSSTLDRVRAASGKLQPVQNEKPKHMPPPASSVPFQPPLGDTPFCPSSENSVPTSKDKFELDNVDWDDDIQDFNDAVDIPVDEAGWPIYRPEDFEMQDERVDESDTNQRHEGDRFDNENYPHSVVLRETIKETFGLSEFRPSQLRIINATLLRYDCFVIMPTGAGKSLCYQLPAVLTPGVTIVVSPLISLILDQVNKLLTLDIAAAHLSGDLTNVQMNEVFLKLTMAEPAIKLLYVTPEKLSNSNRLQDTLASLYQRGKIGRFVVDEAHCVSQWGHDFRPDYKRLSALRENYRDVPLMALTATAPPRVRNDIVRQLGMERCEWFLTSFNRPNLFYMILEKKSKSVNQDVVNVIRTKYAGKSGIVYCLSRKECETMADDLRRAGVKAAAYHAGLVDSKRKKVQLGWIGDEYAVICATIAFGMGIDKADVRFVIHHSLPKSVEGYYQETGRAGRDGARADCLLYYNYGDIKRYYNLMDNDPNTRNGSEARTVHEDNLSHMKSICENPTGCRRVEVLAYLGEEFQKEKCGEGGAPCDNCTKTTEYQSIDVTEECVGLARFMNSFPSRYTLLHLAAALRGSNQKRISALQNTPIHGRWKKWPAADVTRLLRKMVADKYLREFTAPSSNDFVYMYVTIGPNYENLISGRCRVMFDMTKIQPKENVPAPNIATNKIVTDIQIQITNIEDRCYADLIEACKQMASERGASVSALFPQMALRAMATRLPEAEADMLALPHVTRANYDKYAHRLLPITAAYAIEKLGVQMMHQDELEKQNADESVFEDEPSTSGSAGRGRGYKRYWRAPSRSKSRGASRGVAKSATKKSAPVRSKMVARARASGVGRGVSLGAMPLPRTTKAPHNVNKLF
ncbi:unnamed protein product, partial [Brenthis ino]